jgi:hypothetical protein
MALSIEYETDTVRLARAQLRLATYHLEHGQLFLAGRWCQQVRTSLDDIAELNELDRPTLSQLRYELDRLEESAAMVGMLDRGVVPPTTERSKSQAAVQEVVAPG